MKVRILFYGMTILDIDKENAVARVIAPRAPSMKRPYHHPILVLPETQLEFTTPWPQIQSLEGLLDQAPSNVGPKTSGIYLSGTTLRIGTGGVAEHSLRKDPAQLVPTKETGGWAHLDWLASLSRIHPGATLNPNVRCLGGPVVSTIELRGGTLKAREPISESLRTLVWWFSPSCQQAVSDAYVWEGEVDGFELVAESGASTKITPARSSKRVDLFFSHESPRFERELEFERLVRQRGEENRAADPRLDHFPSFYEYLNGPVYEGIGTPRAVWRVKGDLQPYQSPEDCVPCLG